MTVRRIGYLDEKTGEIVTDGQLVWQPRRTKSPYGKGWYAMVQKAELDLALAGRELGLEAFIVLSYLRSQLDFENFINVSQADAARVLNLHRQHVNRAIKKLIEADVIKPGPRVGRNRTFQLNPHFGWKGSTNNLTRELKRATHLRIVKRPRKASEASGDPERPRDVIDMFTGKTDAEASGDTPPPVNVRPSK